MPIPPLNDGSAAAPTLRCYMNMGTLDDLPESSNFPGGDNDAIYAAIKEAGFEGIQGGDPKLCQKHGLGAASDGRINAIGEADALIHEKKDAGFSCVTLHVGWGVEDDNEVDGIVGDILGQATRQRFPVYIETHRATITDDMWRTVQLVERFPEIRFNGDFSHWYTGHEMVYGGFDKKVAFIQPVLDRVRFLHGRIGSPGNMQVDIGPDGESFGGQPFVDHFKELWTRSMVGFLNEADPGDYLVFAPELLKADIYYARDFIGADGRRVEEGDRWEQAKLYCEIARDCFADAQQRVKD